MARCGCNNTCNCSLRDGSCTKTSGSGTAVDPYQVDVVVDGVTITCGPTGLKSKVDIQPLDTDSIDMHVTGGPAVFVVSADVFIQDDGTGPLAGTPNGATNLLKLNPGQGINGLYVSCEDIQDCVGSELGPILAGTCLTYDDAANKINVQIADTPTTNGIKCMAGGLEVIPSTDPGNTTVLGTDGNIFSAGGATVIGDTDNDNCVNIFATGTGTATNPVILEGSLIVDPGCPLGNCGPNGFCVTPTPVVPLDTPTIDMVVTGSGQPGDPWVVSANEICQPVISNVVTGAPCLSSTGNGCDSPLTITLGISPDPCNGIQCRGNGLWADVFATPPSAQGAGCFPGPGPGNIGPTPFGPQVCATITNPSPCHSMAIQEHLEFRDISVSGHSVGFWHAEVHHFYNGVDVGQWDQSGRAGNQGTYIDQGGTLVRGAPTIPPGGSMQVCVQPTFNTGGGFNGTIVSFCEVVTLWGIFV